MRTGIFTLFLFVWGSDELMTLMGKCPTYVPDTQCPGHDPHEPFELHSLMTCDLTHNDLRRSGLDSDSRLVTATFTRSHADIIIICCAFTKILVPTTWNTREKVDYSTFYVSAIIFKGVPRN
jgi:hypothetical protein